MSTQTETQWVYLKRQPGSPYQQLFLKGQTVSARTLYDLYRDKQESMPPEEIARVFDVPLEAAQEAIAYGESNPPEIARDRELDDARIKARLLAACHATLSASPTGKPWVHLDRKPGSLYQQLFVKERHVAARTLHGAYMSEDAPMTLEEIAEGYDLPLEVVLEAMAYCSIDPPEIRQDWEAEEAWEKAAGLNLPEGYLTAQRNGSSSKT